MSAETFVQYCPHEHLLQLAQEIVDLRWKTNEDIALLSVEQF
jgi:hypothetical protein